MEQWIKLLLQWAIPAFSTLVNLRESNQLNSIAVELDEKLQKSKKIIDYLDFASQIVLEKGESTSEEQTIEVREQKSQEITEFMGNVTWAFHQTGLDVQKWRFQQEKELQQQLVSYNRETLLKLAAYQRETTLQLAEVHKILDYWPLRLFPSQLLESHSLNQSIPLRIFIAPPQLQFEQFTNNQPGKPEIELSLAQEMREFLSHNYPLHSQTRPTEFLGGAWESKRFHSESSIKALFSMLRSEPTLILESEIDDNHLNFRMAYWGLGQETYCYETIFKISYRSFLEESAKRRAIEWKETRDKLLALGKDLEEVNSRGGDNVINLAILEEIEELQKAGIDASQLAFSYKISQQDWDSLCQFLSVCHCLVAGWVADIYHLIHYDVSPLLPSLLPELLADIHEPKLLQSAVESTLKIYQQVFQLLAKERPCWIPELALQMAQSLAHLDDKAWAREQVNYSLQTWLQQRQLPLVEGITTALETMQLALTMQDQEYCQTLRECLSTLGDQGAAAKVEELLQAIASLPTQVSLTNLSLTHTFTGLSAKTTALAISPQGETISSCSEDNKIKLWDLNSLQPTPIQQLTGHSGGVLTLALSNDGKLLASSDKSKNRSYIKIWHLPSGKLFLTLFGHRKQIHSLALSPDGETLASGSHKIKLWHLQTGEPFRTLFGHKEWVYSLAISPDGRTIVSGSGDKTVKVWDLNTGNLLRTLNGHQKSVRSVAISPDGQTIVSGSEDETINLWDFESGQLLASLQDHDGAVYAVAISPDGQYIVSGSQDKSIKIWDLSQGEIVSTLTGHSAAVWSIALSPDGQILASGSEDKTIKIWRTC